MEKANLSKNNYAVKQYVWKIRTEKDQGGKFIKVLQKQNDKLIRQWGCYRQLNAENYWYEKSMIINKKIIFRKREKVDDLGKKANRITNCIVEQEQRSEPKKQIQ